MLNIAPVSIVAVGWHRMSKKAASLQNVHLLQFQLLFKSHKIQKRATMFHTAKQNLDTPTSWTLSQTLFGITTHYRRESDNTLSVKIEGELHGIPLFEQMVVLRECDLYHTWAPFCNESRKLAQLDKLDVVAWYSVGSPLLGMVRDACYRAVGCDCMREDGSVLLVAVGLGDEDTNTKDYSGGVSDTENDQNQQLTQHQQDNDDPSSEQKRQNYQNRRSVTFQESESSSPVLNTSATSFLARDAILSTIALPPVPNGLGHGRMTIRNFSASIEILSASSARTKMVVNIDPNLHFLPQSLIDFCMKRMCGVMLARLQVAATKVVKDPIKNPHSRRMREDVRFYRDWLLPKFRTYCDELGWDMPPVKAFEVSEEDLKAEQIFEGWRSADMLDCQDNTQDLTLSPIQQYQHVDNATTLGAGECTHRRCQSESSLDSKSRLRNWGLLKQFLPESFLKHQSSGLDRDDCTPLRSSQSATSTTPEGRRMRDRRRLFFYDNEHRRPQTKEEEATSDRELAALRLKPEPFSESKALRLKELKDAKARAEERLKRSEHRGSLAGCDVSSVRSDFPTTPRGPASISSVAELEAFGAWNRDATIFIVSLMLNVALVPLQSYALTTSTLPPRVNLSNSAWVDVITRILLSLLMIALHATSLWATMNTFLVIAFDTIDFGQKHLAKNLGHGKRLYVTAVKKYSKIVSVAVAAISLCLGFVAAFLQNAVVTMCTKFNTERSLPSLNHSWGTLVHFFPSKYAWVFHRASYWISLVQNSCMMAISFLDIVADRIHLPAVLHCASRIASWIMTKVSSIIPSLLKRSGSSMLCFLIKTLPNALVSHLNVCEINFVTTSWRYQSVKISSFITSRLGMFLLALLFMSYILLPKPERKLCQTEVVKDANALINAQLIGEVKDDDSLSDVSARTGVSRGKHNFLTLSSGSVPMEVIEE
ncbi:hypothetical protein HJC23_009238 [Cyclotella cryptica]|uniref:Uncharacterized protein n=1 Tax=Cyclotella cryptica TaxID=29204 RepID=A0ABD3QBF7_9STRA